VDAVVVAADVETSVVVEVEVVIVETSEEEEVEVAVDSVAIEAVVAMVVVVAVSKVPRCLGKYARSFVLDWQLTQPLETENFLSRMPKSPSLRMRWSKATWQQLWQQALSSSSSHPDPHTAQLEGPSYFTPTTSS
jgi:hypothetical protein